MSAFMHAIGTVVAGAFATARLSMVIPQTMALSGTHGRYEIIDLDGRVWTQGEFDELTSEASQVSPGQQVLSASVQVAIPASLPANNSGTTYQIRWTLETATQPLHAFENFTVLPSYQEVVGAKDAVELIGDNAEFQLILPAEYEHVEYEIYQGNARVAQVRPAKVHGASQSGYVYSGRSGPAELRSSGLDPFSIVWSYWNGDQDSGSILKQRESTQLFVVTNIILDAVKDVQTAINRGYADSGIAPGTTFDVIDMVKYLRQGRDHFNAADKPTEFSMIAARGPIRWFWIGYAIVAAARAQFMAEGMKAFNFTGSQVTLDVDKTTYWQQMADGLEQQLNEQVKPFKDNLVKKGILGGDGSSMALRPGAVGSIGVSIHGLSPIRGLYGMGSPFSPYTR